MKTKKKKAFPPLTYHVLEKSEYSLKLCAKRDPFARALARRGLNMLYYPPSGEDGSFYFW